MRVAGTVSDTKWQDEEDGSGTAFGTIYEVLICSSCETATIRAGHWHDGLEEEDWAPFVLYPEEKKAVVGLPDLIRREYDEADRIANISPNAYAVLLGRVIDCVCEDRHAVGESLHARLTDLAAKNEIPQNLADMAHQLRHLRNVGAHANLGTLTDAEIPVLESLCRAVLEYVYEAPHFVAAVRERLAAIRQGH